MDFLISVRRFSVRKSLYFPTEKHDIIPSWLNNKFNTKDFARSHGCISIGDYVMIGDNTMILPNVRIGSNVIIGAGSIVAKDIPNNIVAAGKPCKFIGDF